MKKLLTIALVALFSASAYSAEKTAFSCFMKNGKHLSVMQNGNLFRYSYGKPGKPEMVFTNHEREMDRMCGTRACNVTMINKGIEYIIWANFREENDGSMGGGVMVEKNGKSLANTYCDEQREIIYNFNLPPIY